jgi:hypothetical protein
VRRLGRLKLNCVSIRSPFWIPKTFFFLSLKASSKHWALKPVASTVQLVNPILDGLQRLGNYQIYFSKYLMFTFTHVYIYIYLERTIFLNFFFSSIHFYFSLFFEITLYFFLTQLTHKHRYIFVQFNFFFLLSAFEYSQLLEPKKKKK